MSKPTYGYFKHPDGEDLVGKLLYCNKITGAMGLGVAILDVQLYNKPKGYLGALGRIAYWTGPALAMSTAFVSVAYIATNIRKKDDSWNYALGGAASGSILGAFRKSLPVGFFASAAFALAGVIKKQAVQQGYVFFPETVVQGTTLSSPHFDFTLTSELPGNWVDGSKK